MLIVTRNVGEEIHIGNDIKIVVLGWRGDAVKIGIDAPRSVPVNRREVYLRIQAERDAAKAGTS